MIMLSSLAALALGAAPVQSQMAGWVPLAELPPGTSRQRPDATPTSAEPPDDGGGVVGTTVPSRPRKAMAYASWPVIGSWCPTPAMLTPSTVAWVSVLP